MSDEQGQQPDEAAGDAEAALGDWLRKAREAAGLGTEAVAAALHLDPEIVEALEAEAFDALGAPVFVKGHVRALASHLELDPAEAMRRYEATAGESGVRPPDLVVQYQRPIRRNRLVPGLVVAIVTLLLIALVSVFLLWPDGDTASRTPLAGDDAEPAAAVDDARAAGTAIETASVAEAAEAVRPESPPAAAPESTDFAARLAEARARSSAARVSEPAAQPAAAATGLTLRFSEACWFEVRDANGRRLATGTAAAGETRSLDGARPLAVTLGVADAVSLTLDGAPIEIPAGARRGRSARLTLP